MLLVGVWKKFGIKNNFSSIPPSNLNYDWSQSDEASQGDKTQASVDIEELVSLRTVREMLKVQESMLRALFDSVVKSLTARVDGVVESVDSLKASVEFSQKDIEELKPFASKLEEAKDEIDQLIQIRLNKS